MKTDMIIKGSQNILNEIIRCYVKQKKYNFFRDSKKPV